MKLFEIPAIEVISFSAESIMDESMPEIDNGLGWG